MRILILLCLAAGLAACAMPSGDDRALVTNDCRHVAHDRATRNPSENWAYTARFDEEYERCLAGQTAAQAPTSYRLF